MWHGFYSLWMEFSSTRGNRPINLISGRKEGRIAWKSQDSFLLINSNPLPSSAWRWKSITTAVMMVHYQFHWLCIITVSHFFVHENLSCSFFYFGHRLKFPLLFSQQVVPLSVYPLFSPPSRLNLISVPFRFASASWAYDIKSIFVKARYSDPGLSIGGCPCLKANTPLVGATWGQHLGPLTTMTSEWHVTSHVTARTVPALSIYVDAGL